MTEPLEPRVLFAATLPRPDHIVIVIEENRSYDDIVNSTTAPTLHDWMNRGASFANYHAILHSSLQNYLALFSGSTQGVTDDSLLYHFDVPNLGSELFAGGLSFGGYYEGLPSVGYSGPDVGRYVRRHNPSVNFTNVPMSANHPFSDFPSDFSALPTVSLVVPNLDNDMHDGTIGQADQWLSQNMTAYAEWAADHNSLLIVTWDEGEPNTDNQVATLVVGANVRAGQYNQSLTHYNLLRTIEEMYGLDPVAQSADATPISSIWTSPPSPPPPPPPPPGSFGGVIRGRVFQDLNGDGRRGQQDAWFAGATVFLDLNGSGTRDAEEPSGNVLADGTYAIANLDRGTYSVRVDVPDGWRATTPAAREVPLSHNRSAKARAFGLSQSALLAGTIFLDSDGDGVRQEQDPALRGWSVYLDLDDDGAREKGEPRVKSNNHGEWTFKAITPGDYRVRVQVPNHFTPTIPTNASAFVTLAAGQVMADLVFGFTRE